MENPASAVPAVFSFNSLDVRVVVRYGEPWFVAKDVATILGYANPRKAVADHCKSAKSVGGNDSLLPLDPQTTIIPERDVYRLIMRSKLPSAERFEEWVVGEVLPSVRKTGGYGKDPLATLNDPAAMRSLLLGYCERVIEQDKLIASIQPKAEIADRIETSGGLFGFRQAAKVLGVKEDKLRDWLVSHDWMYYLGKRMTGKHYAIKSGYIVERVKLIQIVGEDERSIKEMYFTSKGIHRLAAVFNACLDLEVAA